MTSLGICGSAWAPPPGLGGMGGLTSGLFTVLGLGLLGRDGRAVEGPVEGRGGVGGSGSCGCRDADGGVGDVGEVGPWPETRLSGGWRLCMFSLMFTCVSSDCEENLDQAMWKRDSRAV